MSLNWNLAPPKRNSLPLDLMGPQQRRSLRALFGGGHEFVAMARSPLLRYPLRQSSPQWPVLGRPRIVQLLGQIHRRHARSPNFGVIDLALVDTLRDLADTPTPGEYIAESFD